MLIDWVMLCRTRLMLHCTSSPAKTFAPFCHFHFIFFFFCFNSIPRWHTAWLGDVSAFCCILSALIKLSGLAAKNSPNCQPAAERFSPGAHWSAGKLNKKQINNRVASSLPTGVKIIFFRLCGLCLSRSASLHHIPYLGINAVLNWSLLHFVLPNSFTNFTQMFTSRRVNRLFTASQGRKTLNVNSKNDV